MTALDIDCPVCTAKAGQPCKVRKARGRYASPEHYQALNVTEPTHQRRVDKAADTTYLSILHFAGWPAAGRARRVQITRQYQETQ